MQTDAVEDAEEIDTSLSSMSIGGRNQLRVRQKPNSRQQHQVEAIYQCIDEWKTLGEVDLFKDPHNSKTETSTKKQVKNRLAQSILSHDRAILWKTKPLAISFPTKIKLYKSRVLPILLYECDS